MSRLPLVRGGSSIHYRNKLIWLPRLRSSIGKIRDRTIGAFLGGLASPPRDSHFINPCPLQQRLKKPVTKDS